MKNIVITSLLLIFGIVLYSCDKNDDGTSYYTPKEYVLPSKFTIKLDEDKLTSSSADIIYTPTAKGVGYLALVSKNDPAPSVAQINGGRYNKDEGFIGFEKFDVDGKTAVTVEFKSLLKDSSYTVYGVHKSIDSFITEKPIKLLFTTK